MNTKRLLKLARFLEKLPRRKFDFARVVAAQESKRPECGSVCCAIGWAPVVFPSLVAWFTGEKGVASYVRKKRDKDTTDIYALARWLFDIDYSDAIWLFAPSSIRREWNETHLDEWATPKQVAASIRRFVAWKRTTAADGGGRL